VFAWNCQLGWIKVMTVNHQRPDNRLAARVEDRTSARGYYREQRRVFIHLLIDDFRRRVLAAIFILRFR